MTRRELQAKRVVLTGASSGIGRALALQLAGAGARLIVTARREERLAELVDRCRARAETGAASSPVDIHYYAGDICHAETRRQIVEDVKRRWHGLDILINNAGIGAVGPFRTATPERLAQIMEVNFTAPVELIRATLSQLAQGDAPIIVNIGSVLGHVGVPKKSEYCASKFALRGFTDALRIELAADGIDVLWVAPNTTRSEFFDQLIEQQGTVAENPLSMTPEEVATRTISAIRRGHPQRILTLSGRLLILARRWFPRTLGRLLRRS